MARDGADALDQLAVHAPDLVLSDLSMPTINGYQFVKRVRKDPTRAGLPIVAVSALASSNDREQTQRAGFDMHLAKPYDWTDLARAVRLVMRRRPELLARQLGRLRQFVQNQGRNARALKEEARRLRAERAALRSAVVGARRGPVPHGQELAAGHEAGPHSRDFGRAA